MECRVPCLACIRTVLDRHVLHQPCAPGRDRECRAGSGATDWRGAVTRCSWKGRPVVHALVVGSSGYVGARLIAALTAAGHQVTATARDPAGLDRFDFPDTVQRIGLDVTTQPSCRRAFEQTDPVDVAYYLVHSIGDDGYADRDLTSARNFGAAAATANAGRVVYLGGFVPPGEDLSEHLASRADVGDALDQHTDLVWLRAAVILGAGSTSYELVRYIAERLPIVPLPTWMDRTVAPIAIDDVLHYLLAAADVHLLPAGHYDISNGETLSYSDLIRQYAKHRGNRRWWVPVPGISAKSAAPLVALLTPIPRTMVTDLMQSLGNSMHSDDQSIRRLVPDPPPGLTTLRDAIHRARIDEEFTARGVCATPDPLQLNTTDPAWAGGDTYRKQAAARATGTVR